MINKVPNKFKWALMVYYIISIFTKETQGSQSCDSTFFDNIFTVTSTDQKTKSVQVNGCIDPNGDFLEASELLCEEQNILVLNNAAIIGLPNLKVLTFRNTSLILILSKALANLPKLNVVSFRVNQLTRILQDTFVDLPVTSIDLSENEITELEPKAFRNLQNLKHLNLKTNKIREFNATWFEGAPNLRELDLSDNRIRIIQSRAFKALENLSTINLRRNLIMTVDALAFRGKLRLDAVDLSENRISHLDENLFDQTLSERDFQDHDSAVAVRDKLAGDLGWLKRLYLHLNSLTFIERKLLSDVSKTLTHLTVHSNPWQCACYDEILKWAQERKINVDQVDIGCVDKRNPSCVTALHKTAVCQQEVDLEHFALFFRAFRTPRLSVLSDYVYCK